MSTETFTNVPASSHRFAEGDIVRHIDSAADAPEMHSEVEELTQRVIVRDGELHAFDTYTLVAPDGERFEDIPDNADLVRVR
jgi:hypothetical protein